VRPSPPLLRHAAHCYNHSNTIEHAGTGRRHTCHCSSYGPLSMAPSSLLEATPVNHYASTLEAAPVRAQDAPRRHDWNQIRQDGHQLYGTVHHTATRIEIVQCACKLLPPWPIKGGAAPELQGTVTGRRTASLTRSPPSHDIGTRLNQPFWTWRPRLLSRLACRHPSMSTTVQVIQCPEHTTAGRTAPVGTRINQVSPVY
jgi:hypothetical protein